MENPWKVSIKNGDTIEFWRGTDFGDEVYEISLTYILKLFLEGKLNENSRN